MTTDNAAPTKPATAAPVRVLTTEFPFFQGGWSRLGGYGNAEFWKAGGNGGSVVLRVLANRMKEVFLPPNVMVLVERVPYGVDGVPEACRVTLPVPQEPPCNAQT